MNRTALVTTIAALLVGSGCAEPSPEPEPSVQATSASDTTALTGENRAADSIIVAQRLQWVRDQQLDTLPIGALIAAIGRTFVGTPYVPQTLDPPGPERLVVNLRALDCVTFVENTLALARTAKQGGGFSEFLQQLQTIRYRTGQVQGYPSRLHYFSEWIAANAARGMVRNITQELGGVQDTEPLDFMSAHRDSYRQLTDDEAALSAILEMERRLSQEPRYFIPESAIAAVADRIQDGDIIAATSSLPGLDVAHTGFAVWEHGALHLMHAPLVGDSVEVSEQPLAVRIARIEKQDGIMVARALRP